MVRNTQVSKDTVMTHLLWFTLRLCLLIVSLFVVPSLQADTAGLSLEGCQRIALDTSPLTRAAMEGVNIAHEIVGMAEAPYYPSIGANAHYERWQKFDFITLNKTAGVPPGVLPKIIGPTNDYNFSISSKYLVYDWGERRAQLMAARSEQQAACLDTIKIEQEILLNVALAFYQLIANIELEKVAIKNLERSEKNNSFAKERKEVGDVPLADVFRSQVDVAESKQQLVKARNMVRIAKVNLNAAMGLPPQIEFTLAPEEVEAIPPESFSLQMAQLRAMEERPEIKVAQYHLRTMAYKIKEAQGAFGPKVNAEGGYGKRDNDWFPSTDEWIFGVSVDVPIFTGFKLTHNLRRTQAEFLKARAEYDQLLLQVQQEVWKAYSNMQEAYESIEASLAQINDAGESNRLTEQRYQAGASTITDLLDAQTSLARAEAVRVDALWGYQAAKSIFLWTQGSLSVDLK